MTTKKSPVLTRGANRSRDLKRLCKREGVSQAVAEVMDGLLDEIGQLGLTIRDFENARSIDPRRVRAAIMGLSETEPNPPDWLVSASPSKKSPGTPMLFASDWHWGEVVRSKEIGGVNDFNLNIAHKRARLLVERCIDLCFNHMVNPNYPGIVFVLGGDMVSGDIHDELRETNELPTLPTLINLLDVLIWCTSTLADKFGKVFIPCVAGNHGRTSRKPRYKFRAETNYDWLLYTLLEKHFIGDKRVQFFVPASPDALFSVHATRFLLTHGDQFRGGDGMIGALGPIIRGDHRKRTKASQVNQEYDVMLLGHWHQYCHLGRVIVNGCFPAGSLVTMADGRQCPIESVNIGDSVITNEGNIRTVVDAYSRNNSDGLIAFNAGTRNSTVRLTPNHRVWGIKSSTVAHNHPRGGKWSQTPHDPKPRWIEAENLSPGDYVKVPTHLVAVDVEEFDEDTCRVLGFYLAEGSSSGRRGALHHADFSLHRKEEGYANFIHAVCTKKFGKAAHILPKSPTRVNSRTVAIYSSEAAKWFSDLCGNGALNKRLREDIMLLPAFKQKQILIGWLLGDGHTTSPNGKYKSGVVVSGTSISRDLINQMRLIALRCGYYASVNSLAPGISGRRKHHAYSLLFSGNTARQLAKELDEFQNGHELKREKPSDFKYIQHAGDFYARIEDVYIEPSSEKVYNLTVDSDHSYIINGVGVANSLKGYDEYANGNGFSFEPAQQALWVVHPRHGITFRMPVILQDSVVNAKNDWISWRK